MHYINDDLALVGWLYLAGMDTIDEIEAYLAKVARFQELYGA